MPVVVIMCAIWLTALLMGADVMPFWKAFLLFVVLGVVVSSLTFGLNFASSRVQITRSHVVIGMRILSQRSIRGYGWETVLVDGAVYQVLRLSFERGRQVRVALPPGLPPTEVDRALISVGISAKKQ